MSTKNKNKSTPESRIALVKAEGNTASLSANPLFAGGSTDGLIIKSRSPLIKPEMIPTDRPARGVLKRLISCTVQEADSKAKTPKKYGCLIELVPVGAQVGGAIPATAIIANALEITDVDTENPQCPYIGHEVAIQRLQDKLPSKRGNAAWNFIVAIGADKV